MKEPVWMEDWETDGDRIVFGPDGLWLQTTAMHPGPPGCVAKLAAAAPALVRALLPLEWSGCDNWGAQGQCPECGHDIDHTKTCSIDAALVGAGFPDAASRDAAREVLSKGRS